MSSFTDSLWLALIGLLAGAGGGLLGIGGSTVMIPGMVLLFGRHQQHLYQATAMLVNFFVVLVANFRHLQAQATLKPITRWTVPSSILGAALGVFLSERAIFHGPGQGYLQIGFACFLAYAVIYNLIRLKQKQRLPRMTESDAARLSKTKIAALVGLPAGLAGGLLGVGGGLVAVPAQQLFLRVPITNAIANSTSTILWSSVIGAAAKHYALAQHGFHVTQSFIMALWLIPSAMLGSWITAKKVHQWPVGLIRTVFVILMLYCGYQVFQAGWLQIHSAPASSSHAS